MDAFTDPVANKTPDRARRPSDIVSSEPYFRAASAILSARSDPSEPDISADLLQRHYGLTGSLVTLSSELERTVAVDLVDGRRLILKTSTRPEAADSFRFQSEAIAGLKGATGFVAPEIIATRSGSLMFEEQDMCGYLQTRLDGVELHKAQLTPALLFQTGGALARLDLALNPLSLPAQTRPVLWHIGCWPRLMAYAHHLPDGPLAAQLTDVMKHYVEAIEPKMNELVWQVTHNDPSPFNMLATEQGVGFIDFGDGCLGPRIQDLAIAASHVVTDPTLPLGGAEHLIAGYASVLPLTGLEASVIVGLMQARQSALILINYWRAHLFPAEAGYIKKNVARAEKGLAILRAGTSASHEAAIRAALAPPRP